MAGDVPAWAAVASAAVGALSALTGTLIASRSAAKIHEQDLLQERLLHGADSRLDTLEQAIATASEYRDRVAAALRTLEGSQSPRVGVEPLWSWDPVDERICKKHEAALLLRFGDENPVTQAWKDFEWHLAVAAQHAKTNRRGLDDLENSVPPEVGRQAQEYRRATRTKRDDFIKAAEESFKQSVQPPRVSS